MSLPVILTPEAEEDLAEAAAWYEDHRAGLGQDLVARVRAVLTRIADSPELYGEVYCGIRRAPVRRFPYGVFYRHLRDRLQVIAIFHERRDPSAWRDRI